MAFLRYDFSKQTIPPSRTEEDWMEFVGEAFTHYLCKILNCPIVLYKLELTVSASLLTIFFCSVLKERISKLRPS